MSKIKIPKEIKELAAKEGFELSRSEFTLMKKFIGELEAGKSRTQILYDLAKKDPQKLITLLYIVCKKLELKLNLSEEVLTPKKQVNVDAMVSSFFDKI